MTFQVMSGRAVLGFLVGIGFLSGASAALAFAGGRALETPFGVFYGPNITPDRETGLEIGRAHV